MKISLCMIVKNEENNLVKCIDSIKNFVDEIVIIDTGSVDSTIEIAKKITKHVYDFTWCNDFAKARNFSIDKATNDWVLVLDADELVFNLNEEKIKKFINSCNKVVGRIKRINTFQEGKEINRYIERVNRLFNRKYFQYEGVIHEQVVARDNSEYSTVNVDIEVDHTGYMNEVISSTKKIERNIRLLKSAIKDNPSDPYLHYQMGKSHYKSKNYTAACESFAEAIRLCPDIKLEYTMDLVESYGYALLKCERYLDAIQLIKYENYYENSPDYNFVIGLIYMNNAKFKQAINSFEKCICPKEAKIEGINSYKPNYNIGIIFEMLELTDKAMDYYKRCGRYAPAEERIKLIMKANSNCDTNSIYNNIQGLIEEGNLYNAEMLIKQRLNFYEDAELYSMYSIIKIIENKLEEAETILKAGIKLDSKNSDILYNMGYLYQLMGDNKSALEFYNRALSTTYKEEMKADIRNIINSLESNSSKKEGLNK